MKRLLLSAALCALPITVITAPPAAAQLFGGGIVYDPANHTQNILTAVRSLQQVNNQIQQIANEAQMLVNQARNLTGLPTSVAGDLQRRRFDDCPGIRRRRLSACRPGDRRCLNKGFHLPTGRAGSARHCRCPSAWRHGRGPRT